MINIFKFSKEETVVNLYEKCERYGMNPGNCIFIETEWNDIYVTDTNELVRDDLTEIINIVENSTYTIENFKGEEFNMDSLKTLIRYGDNSIIDIHMWGEHYRFFNKDISINNVAPLINFKEDYSKFGIPSEIGNILEDWNHSYDYRFRLYNNQIIGFDLQTDDINIVDIESIINFYIKEIKNTIDQDPCLEESIINNDYKILTKFIEGLVG